MMPPQIKYLAQSACLIVALSPCIFAAENDLNFSNISKIQGDGHTAGSQWRITNIREGYDAIISFDAVGEQSGFVPTTGANTIETVYGAKGPNSDDFEIFNYNNTTDSPVTYNGNYVSWGSFSLQIVTTGTNDKATIDNVLLQFYDIDGESGYTGTQNMQETLLYGFADSDSPVSMTTPLNTDTYTYNGITYDRVLGKSGVNADHYTYVGQDQFTASFQFDELSTFKWGWGMMGTFDGEAGNWRRTMFLSGNAPGDIPVVPEPSVPALGLIGSLLLFRRRRA